MNAPVVATLKAGRDKPVRLGHPWIFSGAIATWSTRPACGGVVDVRAADGTWLARGLASPVGNLAVRIYTRDETCRLDEEFFQAKLLEAIAWRRTCIFPHVPETDSFRLCHAEADGLSGLIVDQYADHAAVHIGTPALLPWLPALGQTLAEEGFTIVRRYDAPVFAREQVACPADDASTSPVTIWESGIRYQVDLGSGQKTGFYLDQRENRRRVAAYAGGRRTLGAYCYTGAFEVHLIRAGAAPVIGLDRSEPALNRARQHIAANTPGAPVEFQAVDVPTALRSLRDRREQFGMIVLDPPKFVQHQGQLEKGLRAYKDINLLALKLLEPGGILATFSCSGWVKREAFRTALEWAAHDAGCQVHVLEELGQPPDHPVLLGFPESEYLCGLILRKIP